MRLLARLAVLFIRYQFDTSLTSGVILLVAQCGTMVSTEDRASGYDAAYS